MINLINAFAVFLIKDCSEILLIKIRARILLVQLALCAKLMRIAVRNAAVPSNVIYILTRFAEQMEIRMLFFIVFLAVFTIFVVGHSTTYGTHRA